MADTNNLSQFLTDVAGAIKEKTGKTDKIPAANFDTEIKAIETGVDTSDATATSMDMIAPKTAYVKGSKITGGIIPTYTTSGDLILGDTITPPTGERIVDIHYKKYCLTSATNHLYIYALNENNVIGEKLLDIDSNSAGKAIASASLADIPIPDTVETYYLAIGLADGQCCLAEVDLSEKKVINYVNAGSTDTSGVNSVLVQFFENSYNRFVAATGITSNYCPYYYYRFYEVTDINNLSPIQINFEGYSHAVIGNPNIFAQLKGDYALMLAYASYPGALAYIRSREQRLYKLNFANNSYTTIKVVSGQKTGDPGAELFSNLCLLDNGYIYDTQLYLFNDPTASVATLTGLVYDQDVAGFTGAIGNNIISFVPASSKYYVYQIGEDYTLTSVGSYAYGDGRGFLDNTIGNISTLPCMGPKINSSCLMFSKTKSADSFTVSTYTIDVTKQILEELNVDGTKFSNVSSATVTASEVLKNEKAYGAEGLIVGTMPNNGTKYYTPGDSQITIPKGYHSGSGYIRAVDITSLTDYKACDAIADSILEGTAQYIELEYIQSSGTQYIDTGVGIGASTIKYEAKFLYPTGAVDGFLWSSYAGPTYGMGDLYNDSEKGALVYFYGNNNSIQINSPTYTKDFEYIISSTQTTSSITTILNGTTSTQTIAASSPTASIKLFRRGTDTNYSAYARLYYIKIYIDDTLARDYVPAKCFNGNVGLYDKVSKEFFYNQGTGTFIEGGVV